MSTFEPFHPSVVTCSNFVTTACAELITNPLQLPRSSALKLLVVPWSKPLRIVVWQQLTPWQINSLRHSGQAALVRSCVTTSIWLILYVGAGVVGAGVVGAAVVGAGAVGAGAAVDWPAEK